MAWPWEIPFRSLAVTTTWSTSKNWLWTQLHTNHRYGCVYWWHVCDLAPWTEPATRFPQHLNRVRPPIQFTMEIESNNVISSLDILVVKKSSTLAIRVYRKPTHTGRYLNLESSHPPYVKKGLIHSLHKRAITICQDRQDLSREIVNLRHDLQLNDYPWSFIDSVMNSKDSSRQNLERKKPLGFVYIPHVKGLSEKFKPITYRYNNRTFF
jgi:hypothetical protein